MNRLRTAFGNAAALVVAAGSISAATAHEDPTAPHHMSCFENTMGKPVYLRVEWASPKRWLVSEWPKDFTHKVHVGDGRATWCWAEKVEDAMRACEKGGTAVRTGC